MREWKVDKLKIINAAGIKYQRPMPDHGKAVTPPFRVTFVLNRSNSSNYHCNLGTSA
jgi:hypothetical protein